MLVHACDRGGGDDAAAWGRVLAHKVDGELSAVDDALVVDICAEEIWCWWNAVKLLVVSFQPVVEVRNGYAKTYPSLPLQSRM